MHLTAALRTVLDLASKAAIDPMRAPDEVTMDKALEQGEALDIVGNLLAGTEYRQALRLLRAAGHFPVVILTTANITKFDADDPCPPSERGARLALDHVCRTASAEEDMSELIVRAYHLSRDIDGGRRIIATFVPQRYEGNIEVAIGQGIEFDITDKIIAMGRENALLIEDNAYESDDLVPPDVRDQHDGPFMVRIRAELERFFHALPAPTSQIEESAFDGLEGDD